MLRITEPEIMDDEEQVRAYALADFEEPHSQFIALLGEKLRIRRYCAPFCAGVSWLEN
jgi:hypothetical protein